MHELVARSSAWQVRAAKRQCKSRRFCALRNLNYTTRANIAHERAEQIRARIVCTPAERGLTHMRSMCVGVAETGLGGRGWSLHADGMEYIFFAFSVGYAWAYIVGRRLAAAV